MSLSSRPLPTYKTMIETPTVTCASCRPCQTSSRRRVPNSAAASAPHGRQPASATTAPKANLKPAGAGAASRLLLRREGSTSGTTSNDQWAISTHLVQNTASMAAVQGLAVAAAASVRSVCKGASSTAPVANGAMSAP